MTNLILKNADIYTMNDEQQKADTLIIEDNKIKNVGEWEQLKHLVSPDDDVIDLEKQTVIPGFIDAHQHIVPYGFNLKHVNCQLNSIKDVVHAIEKAAQKLNDESKWIIGYGLDESKFEEGREIHQDDFSHIKNPIYITRFCLHSAYTNQTSLSLANIDVNTTVPGIGRIEQDENGVTGVLREKAMDLVSSKIPPYTIKDIEDAIQLGQQEYLKQGITGVHEAGMGLYTKSINEFKALQKMVDEKTLTVRMYAMILEEYWDQMKKIQVSSKIKSSDFFKLGSIKFFSDGALSSQTAAMKDAYIDPPNTHGLFMYDKEVLEEKVLNAHLQGEQIAIHAIGDAAVERVITAYEKALKVQPRVDHRHRIEHCGISNPELLKRMKKLELTPVPHPGVFYLAGDVYKRVLKEDIFKGLYNVKSFIEYDLNPALSSDCPVVPSPPLYTIYAAVARETIQGTPMVKNQAISILEAVELYTKNAARASFSEKTQGQIKNGYFADLVVLPKDFMNFNLKQLKNAAIHMTIVNGQIKYKK